jgi:hypothetical protein
MTCWNTLATVVERLRWNGDFGDNGGSDGLRNRWLIYQQTRFW